MPHRSWFPLKGGYFSPRPKAANTQDTVRGVVKMYSDFNTATALPTSVYVRKTGSFNF